MEWTKIPTDLIASGASDLDILAIVKYQLVWALLERKPDDKNLSRFLTPKQIQRANTVMTAIERQVNSDINSVNKKRNRQKIYYEKNQSLKEKSDSHTDIHTDDNTDPVDKIIVDKNPPLSPQGEEDSPKEGIKPVAKKGKLKESDIVDFNTLFSYWEQNKKGSKYKDDESRGRMLKKLKELTGNNLTYAKESIFFAIDNGYQGFCNGSELYYKGKPKNSFGNWDSFND